MRYRLGVTMGSELSILNRLNYGSSLSLRQVCSMGSALSVLDYTWVASSMSVRCTTKLGSMCSIFSMFTLPGANENYNPAGDGYYYKYAQSLYKV